MVSELLIGRLGEHNLFPEARGQVAVGIEDGIKGSLSKVAQSNSAAPGRGVAVIKTAISNSFLGTWADKMPVPLGSGIRCANTEPQWPATLQGTVPPNFVTQLVIHLIAMISTAMDLAQLWRLPQAPMPGPKGPRAPPAETVSFAILCFPKEEAFSTSLENEADLIKEHYLFFKAVSLCHTMKISNVQSDICDGLWQSKLVSSQMENYASSSDKKSLVEAAARIGIVFVGNSEDIMEIKILGKLEQYKLLHVLEFD
ncbi:Putative phospholipid-transporting ATPase IF [Fukomys damarensis]|uniref:Putative phospholipid-transporting ATPase IF n=1 Tax=Fukomys damarensis TaxID=885580 RepID=A0A091CUR6_FUKDA|nr:Putative phospholipid-transporting ATPase IF [Fukomys damarensis]